MHASEDKTQIPSDPEPAHENTRASCRRERIWITLLGLAIGALLSFVICHLVFMTEEPRYIVTAFALASGLLVLTRFRRIVWAVGVLTIAGLLTVTFTPLVPWLLSGQMGPDPLEQVDAVVAISAGIRADGTPNADSRDRALHAFELLHAGYAPRLVLPGGPNSWVPAIRQEMARLGLNFPLEDAGPVSNTHDEALAVARVFHQHNWRHVILVTNAWHMRRAAAVFRKAGVSVICSPCSDTRADMVNPTGLDDRLRALACWLHETIGLRVYHWRGWI